MLEKCKILVTRRKYFNINYITHYVACGRKVVAEIKSERTLHGHWQKICSYHKNYFIKWHNKRNINYEIRAIKEWE